LSSYHFPPLVDCHLHSHLSADGSGSIPEFCRRAIERGLTHVCFTEHADFDPQDPGYGCFDYGSYLTEIRVARRRFDDTLEIRIGVEIDYQRRFEEDIKAFLDNLEFDFVVGGVHYVGGDWMGSSQFALHPAVEVYDLYFDEVEHLIKSGLADVLGHLDLIKRYRTPVDGPFDLERWGERIEKILVMAIERDIGLEINTSGLRQAPQDSYPALETIELYRALGGQILTVGSDAHEPDDVGANVQEALDLARRAGYEQIHLFRHRKPKSVRIQ